MKHLIPFFLLFILTTGCAPSSLDDFKHEGESHLRDLCNTLHKVQSREGLVKAEPVLNKKFNALVDLMIEARMFQVENPEEKAEEGAFCDHFLNEALLIELKRVYQFEGGREIVEKAQKEALIRLDAFERKLVKERTRPPQKF